MKTYFFTFIFLSKISPLIGSIYIWERVFFDTLDDFEFLAKNGTMDHAKFSHHIKIVMSQILVTMAKYQF